MIASERVLLDADFSQRFTILQCADGEAVFKEMFRQLNRKPCLNYYVYEYELKYNNMIEKLVAEGFIEIIDLDDLTNGDELARLAYTNLVEGMYRFANSEELPPGFDIELSHCSQKNLGEIHSIATALLQGIELFCSNDRGAKALAEVNTFGDRCVIVKNMSEILENVSGFSRNIKRGLVPSYKHRE